MIQNNIHGAPVAHIVTTMTDEQVKDVFADDHTGYTDVHFGLIPLDPTVNNKPVEPRYVAAYTGDDEGEYAVTVFTNGDNFVEWGEPMSYGEHADNADANNRDHSTGRFYNAPGLHVVVRFGVQPPIEEVYYPEERKPYPAHNPTGLWKGKEVVSGDRQGELFVLGIAAVEAAFADMLGDGWRLCDYACMTDAIDWAEDPAWQVGSGRLLGMYA